ncbi:hypothetical protein [Chromohalobacter canadensis]|uniref:hypothetical protein n=1 Tax=Chromohalobacter canadensis TaxID=141389 RepID=UPI003D68D653
MGWFFFNLLIGNNDNHAKNPSLLQIDECPLHWKPPAQASKRSPSPARSRYCWKGFISD